MKTAPPGREGVGGCWDQPGQRPQGNQALKDVKGVADEVGPNLEVHLGGVLGNMLELRVPRSMDRQILDLCIKVSMFGEEGTLCQMLS